MVLSICPAISNYCYLQLLALSNSRTQGCMKHHPLPWKTYSEYRRRRDNLSAGGQERGKALCPGKQTKWVFILTKEGARRHLQYEHKAMYLGHLLTDKETCLIWSALQNSMYCWAERSCGLQQHASQVCCLKYLEWCFTWCFCPTGITSISRSSQLQLNCILCAVFMHTQTVWPQENSRALILRTAVS